MFSLLQREVTYDMIHIARKHIVIVVLAVLMVIGILVIQNKKFDQVEPEAEFDQPVELVNEEPEVEPMETTIIVDIKGEVMKPGVYEMDHDTRVTDVISVAGGFTKNADQNQINLAQKVQDEMVIIVPKEGDETAVSSMETAPITQSSMDNSSSKIRINHASKEEIETINGIGPTKAQAIIDHREENGLFQSVDDLLQVNGIGEKTLENIKDSIIVP